MASFHRFTASHQIDTVVLGRRNTPSEVAVQFGDESSDWNQKLAGVTVVLSIQHTP